MKTGKLVKSRKNRNIFEYNGKSYQYDNIYQLIKDMEYKTSGSCDWQIIKVKDSLTQRAAVCLIFQETVHKDGNTDWKHNLWFFPKRTKAYKGWVNRLYFHAGFYEEYQDGRDDIIKELFTNIMAAARENECLFQGVKVFVTGWSLGASIAPIACEDIHYKFGIYPVLIAYEGANPCASIHTRDYVMNCINTQESIAFVYGNDIVTRVPTIPFAFKLKPIIYYFKTKLKFPFLFHKIKDFITGTYKYHTETDDAIRKYMPQE